MTGLQVLGTALVLVVGLVPPVLLIVFRRKVVEINRRRAVRLADRYKGPIGAMYRLTGDMENAAGYVAVALFWAVVWVGTIVGGTIRALT